MDICNKQYIDFYSKQYSEKELREFANQNLSIYDWNCISIFQNLSENFIREFQDKVYWVYISTTQNLSENFIREFQDKNKISWFYLRYNTKIQVSDEFTIEFDEKLGDNNCWMINNQLHRIFGPAKNYKNKKEYWYRGKQVEISSDEEYFEWLKYKDF